ncbi:Yip1 family protein [Natrarchaeobius oligotrophus]|uniref:YIP1 family protein n=1 Tax=Natrarchaeobius chitinivorans TaxID=1679083 RepID=A0A3N6MTU5_NATCH|nr:Yip1 family protein [Natrarchaeobius chitinivorans]RQG99701.1 YIP1 family protein [Natrarchaeobius chitinivorans]
MVPTVRSLRQLLLSPAAFFDDHPPASTLPIAAGIVFLFALALVGSVSLLGSLLADAIDATVTMDNPNRPPDPICDAHADDPDSPIGRNCDEPATIERDAGELAREAVHEYLPFALIGPFLLWGVGAVVLYGAGRLSGGTPTFAGSLALAGWAAVPEFFRFGVGLVGIHVALSDVTITDPERAADVVTAAIGPLEPVFLAASVLTLAWQWHLLTGGLTREANIPWGRAAVAVGVPLGLFALLSLP